MYRARPCAARCSSGCLGAWGLGGGRRSCRLFCCWWRVIHGQGAPLRGGVLVGMLGGVALGGRPPLLPLLLLVLAGLFFEATRRPGGAASFSPRFVVSLVAALFATVLLWLVPLG